MSFWNDVFDVKSSQRRIILMQMTILASVLGALADLGSGLRSDHLGLGDGKLLCLAFKNGDELVRRFQHSPYFRVDSRQVFF